eukprot:Seg1299.7 transcript_id=Seg1299.7/GoldUCD/mRNA.D3Y31 product="AP-5 complex subunit zeta-1" protein_id=Seg1299.7/GoldUCD/D3Y31
MAAKEASLELLGRNIIPNIEAVSLKEDKEAYTIVRKVITILSDPKTSFAERNDVNTLKGFALLVSGMIDLPNGVQNEFFGALMLKLLPPVSERTSSRSKGVVKLKNKVLLKILMKEWSPQINTRVILDHVELSFADKHNLQILFGVLLHCCADKDQFDVVSLKILQVMKDSNVSSRIQRFCINLFCSIERKALLFQAIDIDPEAFQGATRKLCNWLIYTPSHQGLTTSQTKTTKPSVGRKITVQEIDGSPSRDFFTSLNVASVYNTDHFHNIHAFSMLRKWLLTLQNYDAAAWNNVVKKLSRPQRSASAKPRLIGQSSFFLASSASSDSSGPVSLSSSMSSLNSFLYVEHEGDKSRDLEDSFRSGSRQGSRQGSPIGTPPSLYESKSLYSDSSSLRRPMSVSIPRKSEQHGERNLLGSRKLSSSSLSSGGLTLKNASVRYCLRLLSQAERIPHRLDNKGLLSATVVEAVRILTLLCQQDDNLMKTVFPQMKRVHEKILGNSTDARQMYPADVQFFVEHFDSMIYNTEELVDSYLRTVPAQLYTSSSACFEVLDFCLRNTVFFERFPFLQRFFPNLLKIIAWHPRSFLYEFLELMPLIVTDATAVELFNSILDIPCTSAMLELTQQNRLDQYLEEKLEMSFGEAASYLSKSHRTISDFFTRSESGGPETIDKLDKIYVALQPLANKTRIQVACQIVSLLLRKFFQCIAALQSEQILKQLLPSLLERIFVLFPNTSLQNGVREVLSELFLKICAEHPTLVSALQDEFLNVFKQIRSSCCGLEPVLASLAYCIGEFSIRPGVCTMEQIAKYYEIVETLLYETKTSLFYNDDFPISARLVSSLISTAGKLAAFSQDFVPKTVLCLTKLVNTEWKMNTCRLSQREFEIVMSRAIDVINVLRLPNVSPAVLCSGACVKPWHLDQNRSRQLQIQAMARKEPELQSKTKLTV